MKIEERVAQAILAYNRIINVMSPDIVYMGRQDYNEVRHIERKSSPESFMGMTIVRVYLDSYLQVARGVK